MKSCSPLNTEVLAPWEGSWLSKSSHQPNTVLWYGWTRGSLRVPSSSGYSDSMTASDKEKPEKEKPEKGCGLFHPGLYFPPSPAPPSPRCGVNGAWRCKGEGRRGRTAASLPLQPALCEAARCARLGSDKRPCFSYHFP